MSMRAVLFCLLIALAGSHFVTALYEDQVGVLDWGFKFVGPVKFAEIQDRLKSVFVGTETHVVASLDIKTGEINWRNVLPDNENIDGLVFHNGALLSLSNSGKRLRKWDTTTGALLSELIVVPEQLSSKALGTTYPPALLFKSNENVVIVARNYVSAVNTLTNKLVWRTSLPENFQYQSAVQAEENSSVFIFGSQSYLQVTPTGVLTTVELPEAKKDETNYSYHFIGNSLLSASSSGTIKAFSLEDKKLHFETFVGPSKLSPTITFLAKDHLAVSFDQHHIVLHHNGEEVLQSGQIEKSPLLLAPFTYNKTPSFMKVHIRDHPSESSIEIVATSSKEKIPGYDCTVFPALDLSTSVVASENKNTATKALFFGTAPQPKLFASASVAEKGAISILVSLPDGKLVFLTALASARPSVPIKAVKALWAREEALSLIVQSEYFELPARQSLVDTLDHEFGHSGGLLARLTTQAQQVLATLTTPPAQLVPWLFSTPESKHSRDVSSFSSPKTLTSQYLGALDIVRDTFGFRQLLVVVSSSGVVFGLNSEDGEILWKTRVHTRLSDTSLFILRTSAHYPFAPAIAIVAASHEADKATSVFVLNPLTGELYPTSPTSSDSLQGVYNFPFSASQVVLSPVYSEHESRVLLVVDESSQTAFTIPQSKGAVQALIASTKPFVIYSANKETGVVSGFSFSKQVAPNVDKFFFHLRTLWSMQFVSGVETIATLGARPSYEAINSVGRVLGNRDVLYKYLNPNMISIATITEKPTRTLTIYAVDSITGNVIFKTSQEKVGPANTVHLVQCENWIVYHYWNAKVRRNEFAVFELFEDESRSNRTTFSSYENVSPIILRQSYVFPTGVTTMSVTTTVGGITNKQVLVGLPAGNILALDKFFLDPRRPTTALTEEDKEEGLVPYRADLPYMTTSFINYNNTLPQLRHIHTGHASLESASLVFAFGLDIFHTRVHPSKAFDLLNEDFNFPLLFITLTVLSVGTIVTSSMLRKKKLEAAWK